MNRSAEPTLALLMALDYSWASTHLREHKCEVEALYDRRAESPGHRSTTQTRVRRRPAQVQDGKGDRTRGGVGRWRSGLRPAFRTRGRGEEERRGGEGGG
eukprot:3007859-Rhodomonas_salina.1